jgi:hypothetical protein
VIFSLIELIVELKPKQGGSMTDSNLTLESLAQNFKAWRGDRPHRSYPKQFWEDIRTLSKQHSISEIAKALGINVAFLRQKIKKKSIEFAPVELKTFYSITSIDFFTNLSDRPMTVRFQSDHEQLASLILALSCYKP